ncbi:RNA-directed DNA polymerase, eukaryota, Reverse transcriptase zinc-binding domain protein [Artemisia annua]|uniref:RNA-directed DNA polymerase, eukaryota, Reverse transcriptase zinc-binding domain protein n=1 Tax=Artemisia annua TaxID=35608 RepID=A0A2U1QB80_ARTAN|nr:RNA-directed DNA polymerase, eukaryota, Reverse transcriptase zinc-binding domain protein [Artemisia annua]
MVINAAQRYFHYCRLDMDFDTTAEIFVSAADDICFLPILQRGCRIIVGWNANEVTVMPVHTAEQTMLCYVETLDHKQRFYCCFIYAANFGKERKGLWKSLECYKNIVCKVPWALLGNWNVSLNVGDHSARGSC